MKIGFQSDDHFLWRRLFLIITALTSGAALFSCTTTKTNSAPHGLDSHRPAKPYLQMPERLSGNLPRLLSQTGAFDDTPGLATGFWAEAERIEDAASIKPADNCRMNW
jgi:hypothetical protein